MPRQMTDIIILNYDEEEKPPHFVTTSGQVALEWMAVISALGGDYYAENSAGMWYIYVTPEHHNYFKRQIEEYESERIFFDRHRHAHLSEDVGTVETSYSALHVSIILMVIHCLSGPSAERGPLIKAGLLGITEYFNGDWWRPITALTLHADFAHLISNCVFLIVLTPFICRTIGPTLTWFLILGGGILGNITTCYFYSIPHRSLGSSTAVFAALGLLAGLSIINKLRQHHINLATRALVASIALVAITGLDLTTDVLAHIFGFLFGLLSSPIGYYLNALKLDLLPRIIIWSITIGLPVYAWYTAIHHI